MHRIAIPFEILLGLFFLSTAAMKALDMEAFAVQISLYGVVKDPALVKLSAYLTLTLETALGAGLLSGFRLKGLPYLIAVGMTLVFSGLIAYGWAYKGLEDCGCFGKYVQMGPQASLWKNVGLLAVLGIAWYGTRSNAEAVAPGPTRLRSGVALALGLAVACATLVYLPGTAEVSSVDASSTSANVDSPFYKFSFEHEGDSLHLSEGEHLVAMLSATCEHCMASVGGLNAYVNDDSLPSLTGLILGSEEELNAFKVSTSPDFPLFIVDALSFFEFIDSAPPRLLYVKEGALVRAWEWADTVPPAHDLNAVTSAE